MKFKRSKNSSPTVTSGDAVIAMYAEATRQAMVSRARRIYTRGLLSAVLVIGFDSVLHRFFETKRALFYLFFVLMITAFVVFIYTIGSYFVMIHQRRILRLNPWVEWYGRTGAVRIKEHEVVRVIVLVHPEWNDEVVRTLRPRRWAQKLPLDTSATVWAAGNPAKTLVISPVGGDYPIYASPYKLKFIRNALLKVIKS